MSGVGSKSAPTYNTQAPANYAAGIGRGATGFTTRSDIGPARITPVDPQFGQAPAGYVAGRGRGMGDLARSQGEANPPPSAATSSAPAPEVDRGDYSESNYDEFSGYSEGLFTAGAYDEDDAEADRIYQSVDQVMENRRKRTREKQMLLEQEKAKTNRPRIADQFADLKRELSSVSAEEWDSIPEIGDSSLKFKQNRKKESFMPVPDSIIANAAMSTTNGNTVQAIDPMDQGMTSGFSSVAGLSEARGTLLTSRLDKMSDSVTGQTVVDPKGYLTSLSSIKISSAAEIGDIKKARVLLQSVTTTNPKHGPGWIAAARVEEYANKPVQARKIILQGCEICPQAEDVWLEAARLHPHDTAKAILANAVLQIPTSVKLWLKAAEYEQLELRKKNILRKALEHIPNSVQLWKAAIELENVTDARIMLTRAVECIPQSVEMWLALAKLETHENARKILNQAREAIPTERATWITAAKLEEAHGNIKLIPKIIEKMMVSLTQYQVIIKREEWLQEAIDAEFAQAYATSLAIIHNTISLSVEKEDHKKTWIDDVEHCLSLTPTPAIVTAKHIMYYAIEQYPQRKVFWEHLIFLEREYPQITIAYELMIQQSQKKSSSLSDNQPQSVFQSLPSLTTSESNSNNHPILENILKCAVLQCPYHELFWLMAAKEKWKQQNIPDARAILSQAFQMNPQSEEIWLAAIKLEWENHEIQRTQLLFENACQSVQSARIMMKTILFYLEQQQINPAIDLCKQCITSYPQFYKIYLLLAMIYDSYQQQYEFAKEILKKGIKTLQGNNASQTINNIHHPMHESILLLFIQLLQLENKYKGLLKARAISEIMKLSYHKHELYWYSILQIEKQHKQSKQYELLLIKSLQECPLSGLLHSESLLFASKLQLKMKIQQMMKTFHQNEYILMTIGRLFTYYGNIQQAIKYYERALTVQPKLGDIYVHYLMFLYCYLFQEELQLIHVYEKYQLYLNSVYGWNQTQLFSSSAASNQQTSQSFSANNNNQALNHQNNPSNNNNLNEMKDQEDILRRKREEEQILEGLDENNDNNNEDTNKANNNEENNPTNPTSSNSNSDSNSDCAAVAVVNQEAQVLLANKHHLAIKRQHYLLLSQLMHRIVEHEPNRGLLWCSLSKEISIRRLSKDKLVLAALSKLLGFEFLNPLDYDSYEAMVVAVAKQT